MLEIVISETADTIATPARRTTSSYPKREVEFQQTLPFTHEPVALPILHVVTENLNIHRASFLHRMQDVARLEDVVTHAR
ncbi:hypothetical protein Tdes44962_MAKER07151 [Teratosphaeria destructans]|uniref:Uncharacterized protein n=1 Tax=Teratosphaeria destructans TaxID=418781 RepID=A0A9W7SZX0_9PEZI|nr:hypothetical protein Tdes44962_MAKER07151 [Teratosphaeria destructans]